MADESKTKPGRSSAPRPACGGGMTRPAFERYLDAINRRDFAACARFYAPSLAVSHHGGDPVDRRGHLADLAERATQSRETLRLRDFAAGADGVSASIEIEQTALIDGPANTPSPTRKGQTVRILNFAFYDVTEGLISQIRSATMERLA